MVILRCGQIHQRCRQQHDQPRLRKLRQRYEKEELCSMSSPLTVLLTHWPRLLFAGKYTSSSNQGSCSTWSTCAAGKYVSDGGTTSSNRKCASCSNGEASDTPGACDCSTHHTCLLRPFHTHPQASLPPQPIRIRARPGPPVLRAPESYKSPAARRIARASVARTVRCQGPLHTAERWVSGNLLLLRQD